MNDIDNTLSKLFSNNILTQEDIKMAKKVI